MNSLSQKVLTQIHRMKKLKSYFPFKRKTEQFLSAELQNQRTLKSNVDQAALRLPNGRGSRYPVVAAVIRLTPDNYGVDQPL